jgi:DNA polymerase I-like protein with 3'-5' exonuclease and polymerase domains
LIKPPPGYGIAYVDWEQQEFGIAAALSGDERMMEAYISGDPYISFAKQAGAVSPEATKESARVERELFKACVLAVQYGMGAESLAGRINQPTAGARLLLELHRETYRKFWEWSDSVVNHAMLFGKIWTVFGWHVHTASESNPRMLINFPMQANGAEMLRLACCLATERGIKVCAPVHDAILIEASLEDLDMAIAETQEAMEEASIFVLGGFKLRTDVKIIKYPDRYMDERGVRMWETVNTIMEAVEVQRCLQQGG